MPRFVLLALALSGALTLRTPPAAAQNESLIHTGREQYDNLQYEESIQTLSAALIRRGNSPNQEAGIYELLGLAYLALGRTDEAEGAFRRLLVRAPDRALDTNLAPRILEFYAGVRRRWITEGRPGGQQQGAAMRVLRPVVIEHRSPPEQRRGQPIDLAANLVDPDRRASGLVLAYRQGSGGLFHRIDARNANGSYTAVVPGADVRPPVVEYYLEAVDENHIALAARGDAFAPLRVVVPAETATPITSRWWFWTGAGVVVAGAAVLTYFLVSGASSSTPDSARLTVSVTGN